MGPTRSFVRRHGLGAALCLAGALMLLAGTAASLGYHALTEDAAPPAPAPLAQRGAGGLDLQASLAIDAPLVPLDPVTLRASPDALHAAPVPGASATRELAIDEAGVGVDAQLALAAGSHRALPEGEDATRVQTSATRAVLAAPAEVAAAAAAALTLAGLLAWAWPTLKTWLARLAFAPAMLLYAKITRAEVFDNGVRERIFEAIRARPGMSASDLARAAEVSWGTTIYHLDVLEQTRMVTSLRKGRYRRYFENGASLSASKDVVAVLQNSVTAAVVETIRRTPGATQKELAAATNMTPQALHWHVTRLVADGIVRKEREGRVVRHFAAQ